MEGPGIVSLTLDSPASLTQLAERYTIGGAAYGPALANFNSYPYPTATLPAGTTVQIPEAWTGVAVTATKAQAPFPWLGMLIALALLKFA